MKEISVFDFRKNEWTEENIKHCFEKIFSGIEMAGGKFLGCFMVKNPSTRKEDLKKTIFNTYKIAIKTPKDKNVEYTIHVPELVNNQFFFIGGFYRIPVFQLIDKPVIYKNSEKSFFLKIKNNIFSFSVKKGKTGYSLKALSKEIPIHMVMAALCEKEEIEKFFSDKMDNEILSSIYNDYCNLSEDLRNSKNKIIEHIGSYYTNNNFEKTKKGNYFVQYLKTSFDFDFFTKKWFKTDNVIFEILNAIWEGPKDDMDVYNKRVRFMEYLFQPLLKKVHQMIMASLSHKEQKFQIHQNVIIEYCNTSATKENKESLVNIVHYNNVINPVSELANILKVSIVGIGALKKGNVPLHLRNMDFSQIGIFCPADTPDRDSCGVILNFTPSVKLYENGTFVPTDENKSDIVSKPISLVPFLMNDDATRLQMASNQIKQSLMLKEIDVPFIITNEYEKHFEETMFLHKAEDDGKVLYLKNNLMVVYYKNLKKIRLFKYGLRPLYLGSADIMVPHKKHNEEFNKGETLVSSKFFKNGKLVHGKNFLTGIMIFKGYNYEDGIVISKSAAEKLTSIHTEEIEFKVENGQILLSLDPKKYKPIPEIGEKIEKGGVYAKLRNIDWEKNIEELNIESYELKSPLDMILDEYNIYPNVYTKKVKEFHDFIKNYIINKKAFFDEIYNIVYDKEYDQKEYEREIILLGGITNEKNYEGKYYVKNKKITGGLVKMLCHYEENASIGDKLANRHGNKGVIAKVIPDEEMPVLEDGRRLEIIINPLGIISRMNIGQLFELALGECIYKVRCKVLEMISNKESSETIFKYVEDFLSIIQKKEEDKNKIMNEFKMFYNINPIISVDSIYSIQSPFESCSYEDIKKAMNYTGSSFKYNCYVNGEKVKNPIAAGYIYFSKLVHRASDKISSRSIGPYNKKTLQPVGGRSNKGGHRLGEMEVWALLGHGAKDLLKDLISIHADSAGLKDEVIKRILLIKEETEKYEKIPQSFLIFKSYCNIMGFDIS